MGVSFGLVRRLMMVMRLILQGSEPLHARCNQSSALNLMRARADAVAGWRAHGIRVRPW